MNGVYVVIFTVRHSTTVDVGAQGSVEFTIGEYGYVGSANGQGGIESRVGRHLATDRGETENLFWHIDYILDSNLIEISTIYYSTSLEECELVTSLKDEQSRSFDSLGASDCSCDSHIVRGNVTGSCRSIDLERFEATEEE